MPSFLEKKKDIPDFISNHRNTILWPHPSLMNLLEVNSVTKKYAGHTALNGVSMAIPKGSIFGLLGPNGAGKTTLIRIINQIIAPDSGEVYFEPKTPSRPHRKDWLFTGRTWSL